MENKNELTNKKENKEYFDPFFDSLFSYPSFFRDEKKNGLMKTNIKENNDSYELEIEVPGVKKDNISINYENGYLVVATHVNNDSTSKDKKGNIIREERYTGSYKRSFYVGNSFSSNDIDASLNDGLLKIVLKKPQEKEHKSYITIR